ncbi:MAG: DUF4962 domain-containing protein [bacterium]|nr:DUF4962 domain-containing protein [bacterium]
MYSMLFSLPARILDGRGLLVASLALMTCAVAAGEEGNAAGEIVTGHPRLYCTTSDLEALRLPHGDPQRRRLWRNLEESARWCMEKAPREEWIAPAAEDPIYENLYDRFYAMMMDTAITEHLAFAYALTGKVEYGEAARRWTLACCRAWRPDADAAPDGGKAYAVTRLLKGAAVGYDLAYDRFEEAEREEIRAMLTQTAHNYYLDYFSLPSRSGSGFHTHHAVVEYASLGVAALALLGEAPEAQEWLDATIAKFEDHLLPTGLAPDGAQVEGATFWASTMHYRLFFMDALRRVTGRDLFGDYAQYMNADLALASVACGKRPGWNRPNESVVFSPSYGQLDYYAPALLCLAREYRRPEYQCLALWDATLGGIQQTRYITPNRREQLLFELGGYACLWYDETVPIEPVDAALSYAFPSVCQAYARASWESGGILAAIGRGGELVVHAGGAPVVVASGLATESTIAPTVKEAGASAELEWQEGGQRTAVELRRPHTAVVRWQDPPPDWSFWIFEVPTRKDGGLVWGNGIELRMLRGRITDVQQEGHAPSLVVGMGRLTVFDPAPRRYPLVNVAPDENGVLELQVEARADAEGTLR